MKDFLLLPILVLLASFSATQGRIGTPKTRVVRHLGGRLLSRTENASSRKGRGRKLMSSKGEKTTKQSKKEFKDEDDNASGSMSSKGSKNNSGSARSTDGDGSKAGSGRSAHGSVTGRPTVTPGAPSSSPTTLPPTPAPTVTPGAPSSIPTTIPPTTSVPAATVAPGSTSAAPTLPTPGSTPPPTASGPAASPGSPTATPPTLPPTTNAPGSTPPPTASGTTAIPEATPAPTPGSTTTTPATPAPTEGTTTTKPVVTPAPTTPAPSAASSTTKPLSTPAPTTGDRGPTMCFDNPQDYTVRIDIQIQYPNDDFAACDSAEQDNAINANIQAVLNDNFATTIPDWVGEAMFDTFVFDPDQEVTNFDPFVRRRKLRLDERDLQEGTCPPRDVECTADFCRWGCVTASTTDCGTSALTNWWRLGEDIRDRLSGLGFDCLGNANELEVVLLVEDTETGAGSRTAFWRDTSNKSNKENVDPNEILLGSEGGDGEQADDQPTRTIHVKSELDFHFFEGEADAPSEEDVSGLVREIKAFFTDRIGNDPRFADDFIQFDVSAHSHKYLRDADANTDTFELDFRGDIVLALESQQKPKEVAKAMSEYSFNDFIEEFVWETPPFKRNQFYETKWVQFIAHGAQ